MGSPCIRTWACGLKFFIFLKKIYSAPPSLEFSTDVQLSPHNFCCTPQIFKPMADMLITVSQNKWRPTEYNERQFLLSFSVFLPLLQFSQIVSTSFVMQFSYQFYFSHFLLECHIFYCLVLVTNNRHVCSSPGIIQPNNSNLNDKFKLLVT